ncbi:MAG: FlgO family outer membrane protein [Candidatus Anstonellales archaeon]
MRKVLLPLVVLILLAVNSTISLAYEKEIKALSSTMAEGIANAGKKTVAVVDFTDLQGNVTELGRFIAEELSVDLTVTAKGFEVIDRTHLKSILAEHKLSISGLVDPNTVKKLGQIAGVDAIVTGSVTPFGDSIRVTCKVIATDTARVIGAGKGDIAKTKAIEELLGKGIETKTTTEGATTEKTKDTPSPTKPKSLPKVEVNDFIFEAKECKMKGQKVYCFIAVTNNDQKVRKITFHLRNGDSILVDDLGNQYNSAAGWFGGRGGEGYAVEQEVPTGLAMNLVIEYREVATTTRYVNVVIDAWSNNSFKAVLRNIPLSR